MTSKAGIELIDSSISEDFEVKNLRYDSRIVEEGDVFFAIKGFKADGNIFIEDACKRGAKAIISERTDLPKKDGRIYRVNDCRKAMAEMSNAYYDYPSRKLKMIGVTGTNGKTTVTSIINFVLEQSGMSTGLIGTNGNIIKRKLIQTSHTTPESVDLNALLNNMVKQGVEYATMEVSSHSLELKRVYGIDFDIAVFTNLTQEHLDFHSTMDVYFSSKKKLFDSIKKISSKGYNTKVIYNSDDGFGDKIVENTEAERISYGFKSALYTIKNLSMNFDGMKFEMLVPFNGEGIDRIEIVSNLTGRFNTHNILASTAVLKCLNVPYNRIAKAIKQFKPVEGRFNQIKLNNGTIAIIDYSHTPDSLLNAITTIREILGINKSNGRIITVFGCGGNRDKTKRPQMGKIATQYSDYVVITSDNPRDEEPLDIIEDVKSGISSNNYSIEENREKAIEKAINMSMRNDIILVAGKGHETYQEIKGVKHHLSDRETVEKFT